MKNSSFTSAIADIKAKLSIVDVIQGFVSLKKSGKNHIGLCPFHDDNNPSMHVNDEKGFFHCFSCGAGGDVFGFLMRYSNIGFREALKELAQKAGVRLPAPRPRTRSEKKKEATSARFFEINSLVCSFYSKNLRSSAKNSAWAREYLESRGISSEIIEEFKLGFAPDRWDAAVKFASKNNIGVKELEELGLVVARESGSGHYDRFRNRIIFPINEITGRICGFGGRTLSEDESKQPKYMNSPESPVFDKRSVLYGLYHSKSEIGRKRKAVLVEGYMDFIKLYANGIRNVVATLGTAFTNEHARFLRRFCEEVVIVYDGDTAGIRSAVRAGEILLEQGISSSICRIPDGLDPDDYLEEHGPESLAELIAAAVDVSDFIIDDTFARYREKKMSSGESIKFLVDLVSKIKDPVRRAEAVSKATGLFGIRESEFLSLVKTSNPGRNRGSLAPTTLIPEKSIHEREIVRILLKFPHLMSAEKIENIGRDFENGDLKVILKRVGEGEFTEVSSLMSSFEKIEMQQLLSELIFSSDDLIDDTTSEKILNDCVKELELRNIAFKRNEVIERIRKQRDSSDKTLERKLVEQYRDLVSMEKTIRGTAS
ncbi:MAG: DNA primase [Candidatus Dadabacteria bacterium]|nr:DNA primase [Candidatus Dadabacteria bacterium]MDE0292083.1 DNA primase [Candidatus Dadabacteria bacterium]MDE0476493.1 DNA primase [Candidatus Dadabacteria bacterium]MXZ48910.1 DNA primase [Candidatus Dadabacteria bacterium]